MGAILIWSGKIGVVFLAIITGYLIVCNIYGTDRLDANDLIGKVKTFYDDLLIRYARDDQWKGVMCRDNYGQPVTREEVRVTKGLKQRSNLFLTIGIPTIQRKINGKSAYYLNTTLSILINELSEQDKKEVMIVIFCADQERQKRDWIISNLRKNFQKYFDDGLIHVITAPDGFYSKLDNLPRTYNDSKLRVKWRSKQTLDIAFMFYYMHGLSKFYLHLEDDIRTVNGFYQTIKQDTMTKNPKKKEWVMLSYSMGFIGKLIKYKYLSYMADFLRIFYYEMPPDWLYGLFLATLNRSGGEIVGSKTLFHHLGKQSSSDNTGK